MHQNRQPTWQKFSYLQVGNVEYIDALYEQYLSDPNSVEESWRYLFEGMELGADFARKEAAPLAPAATPAASPAVTSGIDWARELKVVELIETYRAYGGWLADINPLEAAPSSHPELDLSRFGLSNADLSQTYQAGKLLGLGQAKLSDIWAFLKETYCRTLATETAHITRREMRDWVRTRVEGTRGRETFDASTKRKMLERVSQADRFEYFLHTRYVAQKRFSLEGGEATITGLDRIIETGAELGATEFVMGMAHRGRLNVLTQVFGKKHESVFVEFEGNYKVDPEDGEGDVKYHKGYLTDLTLPSGKKVRMTLASNPSHLEFVNAVVEGMARARQNQVGDSDGSRVVPILIHGDAAFAGQGVCYETLNMSLLEGYGTGGTLHIVINNQVGFTTDPKDARSTQYATDMAKMMDAPIFHVNGNDVEAVAFASRLAIEYRQKFKRDVFIDLICYRKHGHNEGDEPAFTQPLTYKKIKTLPTVREIYARKLASEGTVTAEESEKIAAAIMDKLDAAQQIAKKGGLKPKNSDLEESWKNLKRASTEDFFRPVRTQLDAKTLVSIAEKINSMPAGFQVHPKLARFFEARLKAVRDGKGIDWGSGEALAYASLMAEGHSVRLSGQDVERGTFSHRQSVLHDFETGQLYRPFDATAQKGAKYLVHNSFLSETGVMGFEYGYSIVAPESLVIWEGQFGDFANGAQVIIDQFLASGETKWQRMSGLVLLLPHGYEGQGPEHSSARLERFLQLAGQGNMIVGNFSTPAQIFHALRRQVKRDFRKPLVVMSPKSLLRLPAAVSELSEFTERGFQEVLDDTTAPKTEVKRVLLCSGKVYYDLAAERERSGRKDVAIVRVEQLYPWPADMLAKILGAYSNAREYLWVQEEPRNMGAWTFVFGTWAGALDNFSEKVGGKSIRYAGRPTSASPAVGSPKWSEQQQKDLVAAAFA
jgi:2-oxoglutarate dehydrogenase E1 component